MSSRIKATPKGRLHPTPSTTPATATTSASATATRNGIAVTAPEICSVETPLSGKLSATNVELRHSVHAGRGVYATARLTRGSTVLAMGGLGIVVGVAQRGDICDFCVEARASNRCARCKNVFYCCRECQRADWETHRFACVLGVSGLNGGTQSHCQTSPLGAEALMLVKVVCALQRDPPSFDDAILREAFYSLLPHLHLRSKAQLADFDASAQQVLDLMGPRCSFAKPELVVFLGRFASNSFSMHDCQLFTFGEGTFPVGSLFNHSCNPNCIVLYDGRVQIIRTVREVQIGEELVDCYVDGMADKLKRSMLLSSRYFFNCQCERCGPIEDLSLLDAWMYQKPPLSYCMVDKIFQPILPTYGDNGDDNDIIDPLNFVLPEISKPYQPILYNQPLLPDIYPTNILSLTRLVLSRLTPHVFHTDTVYRQEHKFLLLHLYTFLPSHFGFWDQDDGMNADFAGLNISVAADFDATEDDEDDEGDRNSSSKASGSATKAESAKSKKNKKAAKKKRAAEVEKMRSNRESGTTIAATTTPTTAVSTDPPSNPNPKSNPPSPEFDIPKPLQPIAPTTKALLYLLSQPCFTRLSKHQYTLISSQNWSTAAKLAAYVLSIYLVCYERFHPLVGLQWFLLGKLVWNCIDEVVPLNIPQQDALRQRWAFLCEAREYLTIAAKVLEVSHGEGRLKEICGEVQKVLLDVETEMGMTGNAA